MNTISDNAAVASGQVLFFPTGIHFTNYLQVFQLRGLHNAAIVSVARTVIGTLVAVAGASLMGYAISKPEYWARKFWYRFIIVTMYFNAGLIPWILNMRTLGLANSFLAYILPAISIPFYIILVKTYIESIPTALEEAAEIDGAGYLKRYLMIALPLSKPILATIAVFSAVAQWNSFMDTVYLMTDESLFTLQFVLYRYLNEASQLAELMRRNTSFGDVIASRAITPVAVRFTVASVTIVPILLTYPFFQRYFEKGIMLGAVKG